MMPIHITVDHHRRWSSHSLAHTIVLLHHRPRPARDDHNRSTVSLFTGSPRTHNRFIYRIVRPTWGGGEVIRSELLLELSKLRSHLLRVGLRRTGFVVFQRLLNSEELVQFVFDFEVSLLHLFKGRNQYGREGLTARRTRRRTEGTKGDSSCLLSIFSQLILANQGCRLMSSWEVASERQPNLVCGLRSINYNWNKRKQMGKTCQSHESHPRSRTKGEPAVCSEREQGKRKKESATRCLPPKLRPRHPNSALARHLLASPAAL